MSKICPLFSGSTGNSTYIEGATGAVLADVGMSCKAVTDALQYVGGEIGKIAAMVITHEHIDHIKGLKPFLNTARQAVLISTAGTLEALEAAGKIPPHTKTVAIGEETLEAGGIGISRFEISPAHTAAWTMTAHAATVFLCRTGGKSRYAPTSAL